MADGPDIAHLGARLREWLHGNAPATEAALMPRRHDQGIVDDTFDDNTLDAFFSLDIAVAVIGEYNTQWLPPGVAPCSMAGAREAAAGMAADWNPSAGVEELDIEQLQLEPAGTIIAAWLPSFTFIGLSGQNGGVFVDSRSGPLHGCIMRWERDNGAQRGVLAIDIADFLSTSLAALEQGKPAYGAEFELIDGAVSWS